MGSDVVARVLLALILVCMLVLVFQGSGSGGGEAKLFGRYQVTGMRAGAPVLIRTDTETGQVWKLELRGGGNRWVPFSEPEADEAGEGQAAAREPETGEVARVEREVIEPPAARATPEAPAAEEVPSGESATAVQQEIEVMGEALANAELPLDMRTWAADQLARHDAPDSTTALLAALEDPDPAIVLAAFDALLDREDPRIEPALDALADHPDERVAERASTLD